jgi:ferritin heavy chain
MAATFLSPVPAFSLAAKQGDTARVLITSPTSDGHGISCSSVSAFPSASRKKRNTSLVVSATGETLTGVVFQPFEEVKKEVFVVPNSPQVSFARQYFVDECEAAINEQIKSVITFLFPFFHKR